jgi:PiT family inorganic phosphate transporter
LTACLIGAIIWNIITWRYGLPSSSSHALVGGLVGAGLIKAGPAALVWSGLSKTMVFIVLAPLLGLVLGSCVMILLLWIFQKFNPYNVDSIFRKGQLLSAAFYSLGHGGNDAQKTAGIIFGILLSTQHLQNTDHIPFWILFLCHFVIGIGTMIGGWKIVKTMGTKITKLKPIGGFAAESAGAITLALNSALGIPASTTHVICGALFGVGSVRRLSAVRWGVASNILIAWILTIPASALVAGCIYLIIGGLLTQ